MRAKLIGYYIFAAVGIWLVAGFSMVAVLWFTME